MKGFVIAEQAKVVNILPPVDITGGAKSQAFHMKLHQHATILLQIGASVAAPTSIVVKAGTGTAAVGADVAGGTAIPFRIYKQETAGAANDVLDAGANLAAAGDVAPSANDNIFYVVELDASELPDGKPYVQVVVANGVNSVIASAVAILSGARFSHVKAETVTA